MGKTSPPPTGLPRAEPKPTLGQAPIRAIRFQPGANERILAPSLGTRQPLAFERPPLQRKPKPVRTSHAFELPELKLQKQQSPAKKQQSPATKGRATEKLQHARQSLLSKEELIIRPAD